MRFLCRLLIISLIILNKTGIFKSYYVEILVNIMAGSSNHHAIYSLYHHGCQDITSYFSDLHNNISRISYVG